MNFFSIGSFFCKIFCSDNLVKELFLLYLGLIYIFVINFCSRAQKLKFKAKYNIELNQDIECLQLNFGLSYALYIFFLLAFCCYNIYSTNNDKNSINIEYNEEDINKKKAISDDITRREKFILILILFENIIIIIFSFINFFIECKWISYLSIGISGSFNFLLYDYFSFSTPQGEYLTMSGIISLAQFFFRIIEFFEPSFDCNFWYIIQITFCLIEAILCYVYLIKEIGCPAYIFSCLNCCKKNSKNDNVNNLNNSNKLNIEENENDLINN